MQIKQSFTNSMIFILLIFCFNLTVLFGCTSIGTDSSASFQTPKKISSVLMQGYNNQFENYMAELGYSKIDGLWQKSEEVILTDVQKVYLEKKKKLLTKVYPLIKSYNTYINLGDIPPAELLTEITEIITQLEALLL